MASFDNDILDLQELVAKQASELDQLSLEVFHHQKDIASLKATIKLMRREIASLQHAQSSGVSDDASDEDNSDGASSDYDRDRPPHY